MNLGVAIVTTGRCPAILKEIISAWHRRGIACHIVINRDPGSFADDANLAMDAIEKPFCLMGADDVLPAGDWPATWEQPEDSIRGIRCLDVEGRRAYDWARWQDAKGQVELGRLVGHQGYAEPPDAQTYISGHCQVWGPLTRERLRHRGCHAAIDIRACRDAWRAGVPLIAPAPDPLLIHLERRTPR